MTTTLQAPAADLPASAIRRPRSRVVIGAPRLMSTGRLLTSLTIMIAVWWAMSVAYGLPFLFPGPAEVAEQLIARLADGSLVEAMGASVARILVGFLAGSALGVVIGLVTAANPIVAGLIAPFVTFFRFVPPLAWFALVLVWFGAGDTSKVVLIMYTSVFVVALNTIAGENAIPLNMKRMAAAAGIGWWQRMYRITLPASAPYIFAGMRIAIGNAFMTVVAAEMLGASQGLGVIINNAMTTTNVADVFVCILALGALGLVFDRLFVLLVNTLGRRYQGANSAGVA